MSDRSNLPRRAAVTAAAALSILAGRVHAAEIAVDQKDMQFVPNAISIAAGNSVRFSDSDRIAHDVTIVNPDGTTDDRGMDFYNQQIVVKFPKPGVYQVKCRIHPDMKMTVTVKPS